MILADTNIVSTFARVDALPMLARLIGEPKLFVTPATYHELRKAVKVGRQFLEPVLAEIKAGKTTDVLQLTRQEVIATDALPDSLGPGEAESVSVCLHRGDVKLLTNDNEPGQPHPGRASRLTRLDQHRPRQPTGSDRGNGRTASKRSALCEGRIEAPLQPIAKFPHKL